ncbi:MAG TPA: DNA cytosine methyltransferase [Trichocoleus sp.]
MVTAIDNFCGAGGSTCGLKQAGIQVVHAANHWAKAIETHNTNHPEVDHSCVDLHVADPRYFPKTEAAWFSIECTTYSPAGGRKRRNPGQLHLWEKKAPDPSTERSRMGAWDVTRFSEYHRYQCVLVENVVEFLEWELYDVWLQAMHKLGYEHQLVCFNSQFAGVPQSRDRIYVVFHRRGNRKPNVDFKPRAHCPEHGEIYAVQAWKNPLRRRGKYGKRNQYVYRCPACAVEVAPYRRPARQAIDWSLPTVKICDRETQGLPPLSANTLRRIERGLQRFFGAPFVQSNRSDNVPTGLGDPVHTITASGQSWLAHPFIDTARAHNNATSADEPSPTITTGRHLSVIHPPGFLVHRGYSTSPEYDRALSVDEPAPTQTTSPKLFLAQPFLSAYHGGRDAVQGVDEPIWTIATNNQFGLVKPPAFISSYYGNGGESLVIEPSPTMRTTQGHALIEPDWQTAVEECGYRMIQPHEAKQLMGFDQNYVLLGNKGEQFKQAGNAVTPPVAELLGRAVIESLS